MPWVDEILIVKLLLHRQFVAIASTAALVAPPKSATPPLAMASTAAGPEPPKAATTPMIIWRKADTNLSAYLVLTSISILKVSAQSCSTRWQWR